MNDVNEQPRVAPRAVRRIGPAVLMVLPGLDQGGIEEIEAWIDERGGGASRGGDARAVFGAVHGEALAAGEPGIAVDLLGFVEGLRLG